MTYFYGLSGLEYYTQTDYEEAAQEIADGMYESDDFLIMIEMKKSSKSGHRWCMEWGQCIDDCQYCDSYKARNGKNGICKHLVWCLIETGREWKVYPDGTFEKISSRKKGDQDK